MKLTNKEANFIKDILRAIGKDDVLNHDMAQCLSMSDDEFNDLADGIFEKLGNGRIVTE